MPHFTVVPVKDQAPRSYDSLEGLNWVDHRDSGLYQDQDRDTVSSDGESLSDLESLGHIGGVKLVLEQPHGQGRRVALCVNAAAPLPWRLDPSCASCSQQGTKETFLNLPEVFLSSCVDAE